MTIINTTKYFSDSEFFASSVIAGWVKDVEMKSTSMSREEYISKMENLENQAMRAGVVISDRVLLRDNFTLMKRKTVELCTNEEDAQKLFGESDYKSIHNDIIIELEAVTKSADAMKSSYYVGPVYKIVRTIADNRLYEIMKAKEANKSANGKKNDELER